VTLVLSEHEVAMVCFAFEQFGPAGSAYAAFAGGGRLASEGMHCFQNALADRYFELGSRPRQLDDERLVFRLDFLRLAERPPRLTSNGR
jgi:hypothetical protein